MGVCVCACVPGCVYSCCQQHIVGPHWTSKSVWYCLQTFRWSVKEPVPLSHGNLVVHGDTPRRSVSDAEHAVTADVRASESPDSRDSILHEDELPAPETTRTLLSMFRSMEDTSRAPPTPETTVKYQAASRTGVHRAPSMGARHGGGAGGDLLDSSAGGELAEYVPDAGEFENDPMYNADVVRESDRTDFAEMPEQGITRGLLAKFQHPQ